MARTSSLSFSPFAVASAKAQLLPTYAVTANSVSIYEGEGTVGFTITTTAVGDGSTLYYTIEQLLNTVNTASFVDAAMSGAFTINDNQGTFAKQSAMENNTTNDVFRVHIRTNNTSGPIVASSANCTIIDLTTYNAAFAIYETGYGGLTIATTAGAPGNGAPNTSAQGTRASNGRSSSATFQGQTISATGGIGGNSFPSPTGGAGGTASGGMTNATGGPGGGTTSAVLSGAGGGGTGGPGQEGTIAFGTTRAGNGASAIAFANLGLYASIGGGGTGGTNAFRNGTIGGFEGGGGGGAYGANSSATVVPVAGRGAGGGGGGGGTSTSRTGQPMLRASGARGGGGRVYISYNNASASSFGDETSNTDISNTYVIPAGVRDLKIWVVGGGGGGGMGAVTTNTTSGGGGGGAGGGSYRQWLYANAAPTKPPLA